MRSSISSIICLIVFVMCLCGCDHAKEITVTKGNSDLSVQMAKGHGKLGLEHIKILEEDMEGLKKLVAEAQKEATEAVYKSNNAYKKALEEEQARLKAIAGLVDILPSKVSLIVNPLIKGALDDKIKTVENSLQANEKQIKDTADQLASVNIETAKLSSKVPETLIAELATLTTNDAAFREMYQRELGLTDAQMESLKGVSTQQLLTMLGAAGAAAATGGVLAKTGKGREAEEVKELRKEISKTNRRVDSAENTIRAEKPSA